MSNEQLGVSSEAKNTSNSSLLSSNSTTSSLLTANSSLDRRVVCLSAGTAAVHLALLACGVGSEPVTWNMDPELLENAIIDRKAVTGKYSKEDVERTIDSLRLTDAGEKKELLTKEEYEKGVPRWGTF